ncbi:GTP pyrophosphokinase family protein [Nocardioides sp. Root190]|uniref:GTP pyrophosphokinase n=1 Tax=Nocardioides sp. Root190 TaxID=1736488 RepID=UPI0009EB7ED1|nr:GTP pyrophosphokinase family protein [Nocardioides sp. Root190]
MSAEPAPPVTRPPGPSARPSGPASEVLRELFTGLLGDSEEVSAREEHLAAQLRELQLGMTRFRMRYKFALDEVTTKISILREEFEQTHDHSPIEHVRTRLKSPESLFAKVARIGCPPTLEDIEARIQDIAGVRIVCPFASDVYWISDMLTGQPDVTVLEVEDYIARPKPNGYRSLHLIVTLPVFLSDRTENVPVELQIRTIAMDFWASVEHAIYYKYDGVVPTTLLDELHHAASTAASLDQTMGRLRNEVRELDPGY